VKVARKPKQTTVQYVAVVLLVTCVAQLAWWLLDQVSTSREVGERLEGLYAADARAADELLATGSSADEIEVLFPHVEVLDGRARVRPSALAAFDEGRREHLNRYGWEGAFFLAVLVAMIVLLGRTLRQHSRLLHRQQNFLAAVSHELKSPVASLRLSAETLLLRDPPVVDRRRIAERMVLSTERLEGLVTDLLDTARVEEGRREVAPESLTLAEVVQDVVRPLASTASARGVTIEADIDEELEVFADPMALSTVLGNLLSNAKKSVLANGGGHVAVSAERDGERVRVDVQDDGLGFEPQFAGRLFDKFYRPGNEMRRRTAGTGLGLYLAKRLVEEGDGRITAESSGPGCGATFRVWWPASTEGVS
jgi:signal transduction histidine kinase